jgi:inorganic triphosphatase YgiF
MATELEYKLQIKNPEQMEQILISPEIATLLHQPLREIPMETTYYDNKEGTFSALHWTFRHRVEGEDMVVCLKTPTGFAHQRNEWQVPAPALSRSAVEALIKEGAPSELLDYYDISPVHPICGARFLRRCGMLEFPDGSRAELAADRGEVFGPKGTLPILEIELELYGGSPEEMVRFVKALCETYKLREQPYSKFARAKTLR